MRDFPEVSCMAVQGFFTRNFCALGASSEFDLRFNHGAVVILKRVKIKLQRNEINVHCM